ncbi:MAG: DUF4112 domain-containing protein [Planctomycetaceae bacterium]|nr:DUF4112 domain-containing protein [Planctomycetaceae bacterium]
MKIERTYSVRSGTLQPHQPSGSMTISSLIAVDPADTKSASNARIHRINRLAHWLDSSIRLPIGGRTVGWDSIIGLLPGVGDLITGSLSLWIINEARRLGVRRTVLARMLVNTGIDVCLGSIPLLGDVFDATYKANTRNLKLLRRSIERIA